MRHKFVGSVCFRHCSKVHGENRARKGARGHSTGKAQLGRVMSVGELETIREVAPGIHLIKVPLPDNPLKQLNSYLIMDEDRPALVDAGFNRIECETALRFALDTFGLDFQDIDVLATHAHPDHVGNLDRIWRPSMRVYAHIHSFQEPRTIVNLQSRTFLPIVDAISLSAESQRRPDRAFATDLAPVKGDYPVTYLAEGDVFRRGGYHFRVVETPGHEMSHICLYEPDAKIMFTGDHVLERITPNISSFMLETDELGDFLASLAKVRDYDVDLALPGHGEPFRELARRVDELTAHHHARLAEMEELVGCGHHDIIDITSNASWKYPNWQSWAIEQKFFSLGETLAHLVHAVHCGALRMIIEGEAVEFDLAE